MVANRILKDLELVGRNQQLITQAVEIGDFDTVRINVREWEAETPFLRPAREGLFPSLSDQAAPKDTGIPVQVRHNGVEEQRALVVLSGMADAKVPLHIGH